MATPPKKGTKADGGGDTLAPDEIAQLQAMDAFLRAREASWERKLRTDPEGARRQLEQSGGASLVDTIKTGVFHGASHGLTDDFERAGFTPLGRKKVDEQFEKVTGRKVAGDHVRAKAANPSAFMASQLFGALGAGAILRVGVPSVGRARAARVRDGGRMSGGGVRPSAEDRALKIENNWVNYNVKSPRARAVMLDSLHGSAIGFGGVDVGEDEELLSPERLSRAAAGGVFSAVASPLATSAGVAATNLPLLAGQRRPFSRRMLEPPGVTRANPRGQPEESIAIARRRDESAARFGGTKPGRVARDTDKPVDSKFRNVQEVADAALEPIARTEINAARGRQQSQAADAMQAAYPAPVASQRAQKFSDDMIEAFVRRDYGVLGSWIGKVRAENRKDPTILPAVQAAVAEQLAKAERGGWVNSAGTPINDLPETVSFLRLLGMGPSKKAGRPGILESARGPARAANDTTRYEEAVSRREGKTPMRPRHAETMRQAMDDFETPTYTRAESRKDTPPLVARGDDQPAWLNPADFIRRKSTVGDDDVQASALVSGPVAYGGEAFITGPLVSGAFGEEDEREPMTLNARRTGENAFDAQPAPMAAQPAPRRSLVLNPRVGPSANVPDDNAPPAQRVVKQIQRILVDEGIDVGPKGIDGVLGRDSRAALEDFGITSADLNDPTRVLARLRELIADRNAMTGGGQ